MSRVFFSLLTAASGGLVYLTLIPPMPPQLVLEASKPDTPSLRDTLMVPYGFEMLTLFRTLFLCIVVSQALYIAFFNAAAPSLAGGSQKSSNENSIRYPLNRTLLTLNPISAPVLLSMAAASLFRLRAFTELGTSFTFDLREPDALNTRGIYAWVQHPSYVTGLVAWLGGILWFLRMDGVLTFVAPAFLRKHQARIHWSIAASAPFIMLAAIATRVRDEEAMLEARFGVEWLEWHRQTARFVPGVF